MNTLRTLLLAGAALGAAGPAHAALLSVAGFNNGNLNPVVFNDAPGATYARIVSYTAGGSAVSFTTNAGNPLERNDTTSLIGSNFANAAQFITQCGYTGLGSCDPAGANTIAFAKPTFGFTLSADDFDTTQPYPLTVTAFNGLTNLGSLTASSLAGNGAIPAVFNALSTTAAITSLVIGDTAASSPDGDFVLANIAAVPEPATLALLVVRARHLVPDQSGDSVHQARLVVRI